MDFNDKVSEYNFLYILLGVIFNIIWWFSIGMQVDLYLHSKSWLVMPITFTIMILSSFGTYALILKYRPINKEEKENSDERKS